MTAHTDHPLRHWDRTCPACVAEGAAPIPTVEEPTPRTDAYWASVGSHRESRKLITDFARQLERELNASQRERDEYYRQWEHTLQNGEKWMNRANDALSRLAQAEEREREECAKIVEGFMGPIETFNPEYRIYLKLAQAIRARKGADQEGKG